MNKRFLFLSSALLIGICGFILSSRFKENMYKDLDFSIAGEKLLVVVIPSYNNSRWYKANLASVFAQKYSNYQVIYIDDCSTDGTYELVMDYVKICGQEHRVKIIKNQERCGVLANLYNTIHACEDYKIIVDLDGDDWLKHDLVFTKINQVYSDPNVWLTYGQFEVYPSKKIGICRELPAWVIEKNACREYRWVTTHLRTFYAGLFKSIKKDDLLYNGEFFMVTSDHAFMHPMLEMAAGRIKFIPEVLYVYNEANLLSDFRCCYGKQVETERLIRRMKKYQPLPANAFSHNKITVAA